MNYYNRGMGINVYGGLNRLGAPQYYGYPCSPVPLRPVNNNLNNNVANIRQDFTGARRLQGMVFGQPACCATAARPPAVAATDPNTDPNTDPTDLTVWTFGQAPFEIVSLPQGFFNSMPELGVKNVFMSLTESPFNVAVPLR
jgi:hypothetical protein